MQQFAGEIFQSEYNLNPNVCETDGIAILVDMARSGKIDPWNIDIVDVYDKYILKLIEMKSNNLRATGRTILLASVLLRLKSNILEGVKLEDFEPSPEDFFDDDEDYDSMEPMQLSLPSNNVISFDEVLERRTSTRLNVNRSVTLDDLIRHLEFYEQLERKRSLKNAHERAKRRVQSYAKFTADDIVNLAHDEYIELGVQRLQENLTKIFEREEKIELRELTLLGMDRISVYIALLFLSARSDYDLVQDEFYSDLYVTKTTEKILQEA